MSDVIVVGGGVIGLSIAWELSGHGAQVRILEQGRTGREASWAGAGFLPPGSLEHALTPESKLRAFSHSLWDSWSDDLIAQTGIDNGYRVCGGLTLAFNDALEPDFDRWQSEGIEVERLDATDVKSIEPAVSSDIVDAFRLPQLAQVRNPRHLKALRSACLQSGVEILEGAAVVGWENAGTRITAARTHSERYEAAQFVIASGAWSTGLLREAGSTAAVDPVRGQIALLNVSDLPFSHVLEVGDRYLVPRPDGRILIGSTEEHVGFVKQNTAGAIADLLQFASSVVPELSEADLERCWSGLRPRPNRRLPLIGPVGEAPNLVVATGHFRSGLQMSPGTAVLIRELLSGQETSISVEPFLPPESTFEAGAASVETR